MTMALRAISPEIEFSFRKDYLNVSNNYRVLDLIQEHGDIDPEGFCFSDHVYVFNNKMRRKRMKILVTSRCIFLFQSKNFKSWKVRRKYNLNDLKKVMISAKNYTLTAFMFEKGYDLLMDSYRRIDIVLYLAQRMKKAKLKLFRIVYLKSFKMRKREKGQNKNSSGALNPLNLDIAMNKKSKLPVLQETLRNCKRAGYLKFKVKKMFSRSFSEYFFILSNLGLIYFKTFGVSFSWVIFIDFETEWLYSNPRSSYQEEQDWGF